jgi:selenocysteine lyase/cysteine desulfurase
MTRRGFLGGSVAAAVGGLSSGLFEQALAAQMKAPPVAMPLGALKPSGAVDEAYWAAVRSQFNLVDGFTFMNNGTYGPSPRVVLDTNDRINREMAENPADNYRNEARDEVRAQVAAFVGASPDEIALTRSTTEGMNVFACGLDWKPGDEVLFNTHEHGGGWRPYQTLAERYGIKIVRIEIPSPPESVSQLLDLYEKAFTPRTRVLMMSHITYVTGLVLPMKELADLAHGKGALISVDGAHPLGMLDLDLHASGVDHYAAAGQKWLLAGSGTGMLYVKKSVQDRIWPLMGWTDPKQRDERGARKYEDAGQRHVPSVLGMADAVAFQETIGKKNIEARVRELSTRLRNGLRQIDGVRLWTSNDPQFAAGLTAFSVRDVPMENVVKGVMEHSRVWIRTMTTGNLNAVRASTHFYNSPQEVDRLLEGVEYVSKNASRFMTSAG